MPVIYHITRKTDWEMALAAGSYAADSLATEGFIHCSTAQQVIATANRLFKGRRDLMLLSIDTDRVNAEIRHENLEGGASLQEVFAEQVRLTRESVQLAEEAIGV